MRNADHISFAGAGTIWLNADLEQPLPDAGGTGWFNAGYTSEMRLTDTNDIDAIRYEAGVVGTTARRNPMTVEIYLLQTAKDEIELPLQRGLYKAYYPVLLESGELQKWIFPALRLRNIVELNFGGNDVRQIGYVFHSEAAFPLPNYYLLGEWVFTEWGQASPSFQNLTMPYYELT